MIKIISLGRNNILIYTFMKRKEILDKYKISIRTLNNWVEKKTCKS